MIFIDHGSSADIYIDLETNKIHKIFYEKADYDKESAILKKISGFDLSFILQYDFSEELETLEITMNYIPYNLEYYINNKYHKSFSNVNKYKLLHDILRAMINLHDIGIIHGDFKAKNILVDENDKPYIIDFDLSTLDTSLKPEDYKKFKFLVLQIMFECSYKDSYTEYEQWLSKLKEVDSVLYVYIMEDNMNHLLIYLLDNM